MDKTKKWIRMCEKSEEIQIIGKTKATELDDWYFEKTTQYFSIGSFTNEYDIWLPRQDQLQDMLKTTHLTNPYNLISFLWNILNEDETCPDEILCDECIKEAMYWRSFESLEQLWLAFIMNEKHSKVWNKNDWIKRG